MTVFAAEWPGFEARLAVEQNPAWDGAARSDITETRRNLFEPAYPMIFELLKTGAYGLKIPNAGIPVEY
jgi:hypothetical protein